MIEVLFRLRVTHAKRKETWPVSCAEKYEIRVKRGKLVTRVKRGKTKAVPSAGKQVTSVKRGKTCNQCLCEKLTHLHCTNVEQETRTTQFTLLLPKRGYVPVEQTGDLCQELKIGIWRRARAPAQPHESKTACYAPGRFKQTEIWSGFYLPRTEFTITPHFFQVRQILSRKLRHHTS